MENTIKKDTAQVGDPKPNNTDGTKKGGGGNNKKTLKLYLGGIPVTVSEKDLNDAIMLQVKNFNVSIFKNPKQQNSKGCGSVEVYNREDYETLKKNKIKIDGKELQVDDFIMNEDERKKYMAENNKKTIHVNGLAPEVTENELHEYFSKFGKVNRAYIIYSLGNVKKSRGFGFVEFDSKKVVKQIMAREHELAGQKLTITLKCSKIEINKLKGSKKGSSVAGSITSKNQVSTKTESIASRKKKLQEGSQQSPVFKQHSMGSEDYGGYGPKNNSYQDIPAGAHYQGMGDNLDYLMYSPQQVKAFSTMASTSSGGLNKFNHMTSNNYNSQQQSNYNQFDYYADENGNFIQPQEYDGQQGYGNASDIQQGYFDNPNQAYGQSMHFQHSQQPGASDLLDGKYYNQQNVQQQNFYFSNPQHMASFNYPKSEGRGPKAPKPDSDTFSNYGNKKAAIQGFPKTSNQYGQFQMYPITQIQQSPQQKVSTPIKPPTVIAPRQTQMGFAHPSSNGMVAPTMPPSMASLQQSKIPINMHQMMAQPSMPSHPFTKSPGKPNQSKVPLVQSNNTIGSLLGSKPIPQQAEDQPFRDLNRILDSSSEESI